MYNTTLRYLLPKLPRIPWPKLILAWLAFFAFFSAADAQQQDLVQLEAALQKEQNDSLWVVKAIHFTRELHRHAHQKEKEYKFAQKSIDLALKLNDTLLYARALDNMGLLYRYHQWYAQAVPLHIKAFHLVEQASVPPLYKMIFANNAGVAARYDQKFDVSVSYYLKALRIATKNKDLKNIAISSNGLGNALSNIPEREEKALAYFNKALRASKEMNNSLGVAMNLLSIGHYYIDNQQYKKALSYLNRLYEINRKRNDVFGLAITNEYIGHAYFQKGEDLNKAIGYYTKSLQQFRKINNNTKEAALLGSLGRVQLQLGHLGTALAYYDQSMTLADSLHNKALIVENAYQISSIKERQGNLSDALNYYRKAKTYEDSINLFQQKVKVAALTSKYELDKKESHIALLEKEKALRKEKILSQEDKIKTQKTYFIILLAGIALTITFIVLQYQNNKAKKRAERHLQQNEKELLRAEYERNIAQAEMLATRMQVNPHFIFNSLNAINLLIQKEENRKASQYLVTFSRFVRMILEIPKSQVISLTEELELIRYYLTLEEKRFDQDFDFQINTLSEQEMSSLFIPPLLLQPFVENAIWHGLLPSQNMEKQLTINITKKASTIEIVIDDNGVGRKNDKKPNLNSNKKSMGTKITQDRILQFNKSYNCNIDLTIVDKHTIADAGSGTKVVLAIKNETQLANLDERPLS